MKFEVVCGADSCGLLAVPSASAVHPDTLKVWAECTKLMDDAQKLPKQSSHCEIASGLAEACNLSVATGRSAVVEMKLNAAKRQFRDQVSNCRVGILNQSLKLFVLWVVVGVFAAALYHRFEALRPGGDWAILWDLLIINLGWFGYVLAGFSLGWLFNVATVLRSASAEQVAGYLATLTSIKLVATGHLLFVVLILLGRVFLEEQFEIIGSLGLYSPPNGILLGVFAGFAEKRVRDALSSLFDRL